MKSEALQVKPGAFAEDRRLMVVGDIHGCLAEVEDLLGRLDPSPTDVVVSVGDIVRKGPQPARCLELWRERGYLAVAGNNELKLLGRSHSLFRWFGGADDGEVLRRGDLLDYIRSWPLAIDFPDGTVAVVHGGFLPQTAVTPSEVAQQRDVIYRLRYVRRVDDDWQFVPKNEERDGDRLWPEVWEGDRFVVYGHTPLDQPRFDRKALGLDTGCVYGGRLSAAVHDGRTWKIVSVKAKRTYAER
ncbi:MAG: serine/threonine protein phosphatase [Acidobacteria bacterium]|nr:serine/threonine protein phosphatase [Acidobacteriota bacterium]